jgi:hypothetical protein
MKTRPLLPRIQTKQEKISEEGKDSSLETENSYSTSLRNKKKLRRERKNNEQVLVLIEMYNQNNEWTKEQVAFLAEKTGLSQAQVYKWGWDYKKKLKRVASRVNAAELFCDEVLAPSEIDLEINEIQKGYKKNWTFQHFAEFVSLN